MNTTSRATGARFAAVVMLALCPALSIAQDTDTKLTDADRPFAAFRKADPRLEQKVTINHFRVRVGEMLEEVSAATGIHIEADETDGAADPCLAAYIANVRAADLLEAVWSLYSYRKATWQWVRSGSAPDYTYKLQRTAAAKNLPDIIVAMAQTDFEKMFQEVKDFLSGRRKKPTSDVVPGYKLLDDDDRGRIPLSLFFTVLSKQQQKAVLQKDATIHIPTSQLPAEARKWVHNEWAFGKPVTIKKSGERIPKPESSFIEISAEAYPGCESRSYTVDIEHIGSLAWLGGCPLEELERAKIKDLWILPGDATTSDAEKIVLERPPYPDDPEMRAFLNPPPHRETGTGKVQARLWQLSQSTGIPILARLPVKQNSDPIIITGKTVDTYLKEAYADVNGPRVQFKWRNGVLLATYTTWFRDRTQVDPPPWSLVKWLRAEEARNNNWLPISDLCRIARDHSTSHLTQLHYEFDGPNQISYNQPVFAAIGRSSKLCQTLESNGRVDVRIDPAQLDPALITPAIAEKLAHRIRCHAIVTFENHTDKPIDAELDVRVRIELMDGTLVSDTGFYYNPRSSVQSPPLMD